MCVVSMVGDHYRDKWNPAPMPNNPLNIPPYWEPPATKRELDELKKEVLEMKELLKRAIKYDKDNNEPNCEIEEKMNFLRQVAKSVGVDLDDVLKK